MPLRAVAKILMCTMQEEKSVDENDIRGTRRGEKRAMRGRGKKGSAKEGQGGKLGFRRPGSEVRELALRRTDFDRKRLVLLSGGKAKRRAVSEEVEPGKVATTTKSAKTCLALLEELSETTSAVQEEAGRSVEVRTELGERGNVTVLGQVQLERTGDGLHDLRVSKSESESWSVSHLQTGVKSVLGAQSGLLGRRGAKRGAQ